MKPVTLELKGGQIWAIQGTLQNPPQDLQSEYGTVTGYIDFETGRGKISSRKYRASGDIADILMQWDIDKPITLIGYHDYGNSPYGKVDRLLVTKIF